MRKSYTYHRSEHINVMENTLQLLRITEMLYFFSFMASASSIWGKQEETVATIKSERSSPESV